MPEFRNENFRGSYFWLVDLSESRLHSVILHDVRITDALVDRLDIDAHIGSLTVNGVEVSGYVAGELDKRYPERRLLEASDPDGLRAAWAMIEERAQATVDKARALPEAALDESVDGEWSFIQTLRHLVMATDRWITGPVLGEPEPFHPLGLPPGDPVVERPPGLDIDARPSLDEILAVRAGRMGRIAELLADASADDLSRTVQLPGGGPGTVLRCIQVVLNEEWAHDRYANRDLDLLANAT